MNNEFINKFLLIQTKEYTVKKYYIKKLLGVGSVGHIYLLINQKKKFILKVSNDNCYNELLSELIIVKNNMKNISYYPLYYGKINIKNNIRFGIIYPFIGTYNLDQIKLINYYIDFNNIINIIKQIILQLKSFQNIIHCDIKSSNIVLNNKLNPTIIDFGLINNINNLDNKNYILSTIYLTSPESLLTHNKYKHIIINKNIINLSKHDNFGLFTIIINLFLTNNYNYWNIICEYLCDYLKFDNKLIINQNYSDIYIYCWYRFFYKNINNLCSCKTLNLNICCIYKKLINNIIDYYKKEKIYLCKIDFLLFDDFFNIFIKKKLDLNRININNILLFKDFLINLVHFNFNQRYTYDKLLNHKFLTNI